MDRDRITIREASSLIGVHPNTVRNHLKVGETVVTERRETWMIAVTV